MEFLRIMYGNRVEKKKLRKNIRISYRMNELQAVLEGEP